MNANEFDLIIIGAGPAGLEAGLQAKKFGLSHVILEQGKIANTFVKDYQKGKKVLAYDRFQTKKALLWFETCSREKILEKWQETAEELNVLEGRKVEDIRKKNGLFEVKTGKEVFSGKKMVIAIGIRGCPRKLGIEGEELEKVKDKLLDAREFSGKKILVVGGGDTAIENALDLAGKNEVILSYRKPEFFRVKEELLKKLKEKEGSRKIKVIFESNLRNVEGKKIFLEVKGETKGLENDLVFLALGSEPSTGCLEKIGLELKDGKPVLGKGNESSIQGIYLVGAITGKGVIQQAIEDAAETVEGIAKELIK